MSAIKLTAQKLKDQSNLKKIATAWHECAINRGWESIFYGGDFWLTGAIERLAGDGMSSASDIVLNDPHVWVSPSDKYASKIVKESICHFDPKTEKVVVTYPNWGNSYFTNVDNSLFSGYYVFSYCLIIFVPTSNITLNTTPLAFTRGLCTDGTWDEKAGLYGSKGGYVVFCDGHVTWFDGSKPAKFLKWDQSGYTSDIRYAVPTNSGITCGHNNIYKGSNTNLITWEYGK
jgi:prepilin-type processing-associated H-X9-DG protein